MERSINIHFEIIIAVLVILKLFLFPGLPWEVVVIPVIFCSILMLIVWVIFAYNWKFHPERFTITHKPKDE